MILIAIPEPTDDIETGFNTLKDWIERWKPDVLIASSRGGKLAGKLIQSKIWSGPTLLISAMSVSSSIECSKGKTSEACVPGIPIIVVHGINDVTIPINAVRNDVLSARDERIQLIELDDDHSLLSIFGEGKIKRFIEDVFKLQFKKPKVSSSAPVNVRASLLREIKSHK